MRRIDGASAGCPEGVRGATTPALWDSLSYATSIVATALGRSLRESTEVRLLAKRLRPLLTAEPDLDGNRDYRGLQVAPDLHEEFAVADQIAPTALAGPELSLARWPCGALFALLLSHDIDQIYDRELFRVLADVNHIRRVSLNGEPGKTSLAARRVARALLRPKRTLLDFETILAIERRHRFRSTFFVLHDRYFARQGARFSLKDKEIGEIGRVALAAGCELGLHGGYYRFNDATLYRESREAAGAAFGVEPVGIRNHLLRFSYPETWQAQEAAGFEYDATFGYRSVPGPRSGLAFPFLTFDPRRQQASKLIELPLTVMDTTVFRYLRLSGEEALEFCWALVERLARYGALVTLLWHNNFFNEPEYWDWQMVYEKLLERLAALKPWCAPGAEISAWWRARSAVQCSGAERVSGGWQWNVDVPQEICDLVFLLRPAEPIARVTVEGAAARIEGQADRWCVHFGRLVGGTRVRLTATASS